ncbi:hypothetical protein G5V59_16160 [Nocardioides sp. W3-2-3]|uniref:hypothetical protein n=1 Tax=Nocardioides convexus TaxID=2712224 RepID=UPI002418474D|nr:hypothetical protein [Nocardioides convexus]NHA00927.1 hypothetical protein [Nocardioides convexus]
MLAVDIAVLVEETFAAAEQRHDLAEEVATAASGFVNAIGDRDAFDRFLVAVRAWEAALANPVRLDDEKPPCRRLTDKGVSACEGTSRAVAPGEPA